MKQLTWMILLLGAATGLTAQTLTFGEITLGANGAKVVDVILTSGTFANQVAGLQFDLAYDPTQLTVVVGLGSQTAAMDVNVTALPAAFNPSTTAAAAGPGQRAIIIGCCTAGQTTPTSGIITDGVVATLSVTIAANAPAASQVISLANGAGTGAGGSNVAPVSIPLAASGSLDLYHTYLVGDASPLPSDTAPVFGNLKLDIQDLIQEFYAVNKVASYIPTACSDRFDAMDVAPADTATSRGGNQKLDIQDLIAEFYRVNRVDLTTPMRTSRGGVCPATSNQTAIASPTRQAVVRPPVEVRGTLVLGPPVGAGTTQDRVPVYLQGGRDLARVAVTFGLGDLQSQLRFEAASDMVPTLMQDSQPGVVVAAWLEGLNVRAGQRLLLGYVVGPSGSAANLKVFNVSASGLNDNQEVGLDVSGAPLVQQ